MRTQTRSLRALIGLTAVVMMVGSLASFSPAVGATRSTSVASCAGFKNRTGVTNRTIRIGNAADISGPVPGQFLSARQATLAYVRYFNATHSLCGRKLALSAYDTMTDTTANNTAYAAMCTKVFAAVGSISQFDDGGAKTTQACRLPDLRATSTTTARNACSTCFGVEASRSGEVATSVHYLLATHPSASQKTAVLYLNVGVDAEKAIAQENAEEQSGMKVVYASPVDVADFNYSPYVQAMISRGVKIVQLVAGASQAARLAQAMMQGGLHPEVFQVDPIVYTPDFATLGGTSVDGAITAINFYPLTANQTELNLYRKWLHVVAPSSTPTEAGLYAWSAAKLFVTELRALGGKLSRATLIAKLRTVTGWTGGGLHAPMAVGTKHLSPCVRFLSLHNGKWVSVGGTSYRCSGITKIT
jgi:ABC-type branched-subunit amino acid transport system substrate-binding protein